MIQIYIFSFFFLKTNKQKSNGNGNEINKRVWYSYPLFLSHTHTHILHRKEHLWNEETQRKTRDRWKILKESNLTSHVSWENIRSIQMKRDNGRRKGKKLCVLFRNINVLRKEEGGGGEKMRYHKINFQQGLWFLCCHGRRRKGLIQ